MVAALTLFVHKQSLSIVKIWFETAMSLMKCDYVDRLLQLQYGQQKPDEQQVSSSLFRNTPCVLYNHCLDV